MGVPRPVEDPGLWQASLRAGSSESAHAEIKLAANPGGGGREQPRSLQLCFRPQAQCQDPGMPSSQCGQGPGARAHWVSLVLAPCKFGRSGPIPTTVPSAMPSDNKGHKPAAGTLSPDLSPVCATDILGDPKTVPACARLVPLTVHHLELLKADLCTHQALPMQGVN